MSRFATLVLCVLGWFAPVIAQAAGEVAATPEVVLPGGTVTLRWYFTGTKVVVTGGRFGKGQVVTGKTLLTDTPTKTTRYTFTVNYKGKDAEGIEKPLTATYYVTVEVADPLPPLLAYHAPHGWQIQYQKGWRTDPYYNPSQGRDLTFFQPEQDSLERITVAVVSEKMPDCDTLLKKIGQDMPNSYDDVKLISQQAITHQNQPAMLAVFAGRDHSHENAPTQCLVLAIVRGSRCYVVSARTTATRFKKRQPALEKMLRSFNVLQ